MQLAWLAGIVDGEGSIAFHKITGRKSIVFGIKVVNTDQAILGEVEKIYKKYHIFYSRYNRALYNKDYSFTSRKECFEIVVRRKNDCALIGGLMLPYLRGDKKKRMKTMLDFIKRHPKLYQQQGISGVTTKRKAPVKG